MKAFTHVLGFLIGLVGFVWNIYDVIRIPRIFYQQGTSIGVLFILLEVIGVLCSTFGMVVFYNLLKQEYNRARNKTSENS